jgi:uncharacterized protein
MITTYDHLFFVMLVFVATVVEWRWSWPRTMRAAASGVPGTRLRHYREVMIVEWAFTLGLLGCWAFLGRSWAQLRLSEAPAGRLALGLVLAAAMLALQWLQRRKILARPELLEQVRGKLANAEALIARTPGELGRFKLLSLTAGICEEILYRGFVMWYVAAWCPPGWPAWLQTTVAVVGSSALFGFAHIYLGPAHVVKSALAGLLLALIVVGTGSLWPAMMIHAMVDWFSGELGFHAFRSREPETTPPAPAAA